MTISNPQTAESDSVVAEFIAAHPEFVSVYIFAGEPTFVQASSRSSRLDEEAVQLELYSDLATTIIHQQLSGKVARVFEDRLIQSCNGKLSPTNVVLLGEEGLRSIGLSAAKTRALLELTLEVASGKLSFEALAEMTDDEVVARLCQLWGLGPWSAHMFLLFGLGRLNVWAPADLGVRKGYAKLYSLEDMPSINEMVLNGARYSPTASLATWFFWRVLEQP